MWPFGFVEDINDVQMKCSDKLASFCHGLDSCSVSIFPPHKKDNIFEFECFLSPPRTLCWHWSGADHRAVTVFPFCFMLTAPNWTLTFCLSSVSWNSPSRKVDELSFGAETVDLIIHHLRCTWLHFVEWDQTDELCSQFSRHVSEQDRLILAPLPKCAKSFYHTWKSESRFLLLSCLYPLSWVLQ